MMAPEQKDLIWAEVMRRRENFAGSDGRFAVTLGISASQYSRLRGGERERVIGDDQWIRIGRKLDVSFGKDRWKAAKTPAYMYIEAQLERCQQNSISRMLVDRTGIGKTFTAQCYARTHKNAVYVDCSQVKTKTLLIRFIAEEFGLNNKGTYHEVYADLVYYLQVMDKPLIILDEAGDLQRAAFNELKALYNKTKGCCGFYMMGADGLKKKIENGRKREDVGYAENFDRFGSRYQKASPNDAREFELFFANCAAAICKVNAPAMSFQTLLPKLNFSLRRIEEEIRK